MVLIECVLILLIYTKPQVGASCSTMADDYELIVGYVMATSLGKRMIQNLMMLVTVKG